MITISRDSEVAGVVLKATTITNKNFLIYFIGAIANLKFAFVKYLNSLNYGISSLNTGLITLSMKGLRDISIMEVSGFSFGQH